MIILQEKLERLQGAEEDEYDTDSFVDGGFWQKIYKRNFPSFKKWRKRVSRSSSTLPRSVSTSGTSLADDN